MLLKGLGFSGGGGGGGGGTIGQPVIGGDPYDVLFVDGAGNLGQSDNFIYNPDAEFFGIFFPTNGSTFTIDDAGQTINLTGGDLELTGSNVARLTAGSQLNMLPSGANLVLVDTTAFTILSNFGNNVANFGTDPYTVNLGDLSGAGNSTSWNISDMLQAIVGVTNNDFHMQNNSGQSFMSGSGADFTVILGDLNAAVNDTRFVVSDASTTILAELNGQFNIEATDATTVFTLDTTTRNIQMGDVSSVANLTTFNVIDSFGEISASTRNSFTIYDEAGHLFFEVNTSAQGVSFGDLSGVFNNTTIKLKDGAGNITATVSDSFEVADAPALNPWLLVKPHISSVQLGDIGLSNLGTTFTVDDAAATIVASLGGQFKIHNFAGTPYDLFIADTNNVSLIMGDIDGVENSTTFHVDDSNEIITAAANIEFLISNVSSMDVFRALPTSLEIQMGDLQFFGNRTNFTVDDGSLAIISSTDGDVVFQSTGNLRSAIFTPTGYLAILGDPDGNENGWTVTIDDFNQVFTVDFQDIVFTQLATGGAREMLTVDSVGDISSAPIAVTGGTSTIASANDLTLSGSRGYYIVSGTTTINRLSFSGYLGGSRVVLLFSGALSLNNGVTAGGGFAPMLLAGSLPFSTASLTRMEFIYDANLNTFIELNRTVA